MSEAAHPLHYGFMDLSVSESFSFILFGASGHLATLKLYPALYTLHLKKRFPANFTIVGYARTAMDDASFRKLVSDSIHRDHGEVNEKKNGRFFEAVHFLQRALYFPHDF